MLMKCLHIQCSNQNCSLKIMDTFLNKFLSWLVVFSVIISLIFLCVVLIDLNNIWKDLIEHQERIKNLEILTLRKMGVKI